MSQAKVDKYKQEKYNRKHAKKKSNVKKIAAYAAATLVVILFVGYLGYSVAVVTGLYTPPATTATTIHRELSDAEKESIRNVMIQNGNSDVKVTTSAAKENTTTAKTEKTTKSTEKETTAKK